MGAHGVSVISKAVTRWGRLEREPSEQERKKESADHSVNSVTPPVLETSARNSLLGEICDFTNESPVPQILYLLLARFGQCFHIKLSGETHSCVSP